MAWLFFVPFILIATFTMLNLFIAIIVNTMQTFSEQEHADERMVEQQQQHDQQAMVMAELQAIRAELVALRAQQSTREGN